MAANGPATGQHIGFLLLKRAAKFDMTFVPYSGGPPAINSLLGEHVTAVFTDYAGVSEQLKTGALRALAVATRTRIDLLPDIPAVAETYEDFESEGWLGLVAPAKTPKETVMQLAGWFTAALQEPDVKAKLVAQGLFPDATCAADFRAFIRKRYDEYGGILRESNIKLQ